MPHDVSKMQDTILKRVESDTAGVGGAGGPAVHSPKVAHGMQLSFFQLDDPVLCQIRDEIRGLDINNLTPVDALNKLNEIKRILH